MFLKITLRLLCNWAQVCPSLLRWWHCLLQHYGPMSLIIDRPKECNIPNTLKAEDVLWNNYPYLVVKRSEGTELTHFFFRYSTVANTRQSKTTPPQICVGYEAVHHTCTAAESIWMWGRYVFLLMHLSSNSTYCTIVMWIQFHLQIRHLSHKSIIRMQTGLPAFQRKNTYLQTAAVHLHFGCWC